MVVGMFTLCGEFPLPQEAIYITIITTYRWPYDMIILHNRWPHRVNFYGYAWFARRPDARSGIHVAFPTPTLDPATYGCSAAPGLLRYGAAGSPSQPQPDQPHLLGKGHPLLGFLALHTCLCDNLWPRLQDDNKAQVMWRIPLADNILSTKLIIVQLNGDHYYLSLHLPFLSRPSEATGQVSVLHQYNSSS